MQFLNLHPWVAVVAFLAGGFALSLLFPVLRMPRSPGGRTSFWLVAGLGAAACVAVLVLPWGSDGQARAAISCIGALLVLLAWLRPGVLWNGGNARDWRLALGDTGFVLVYAAVGLAIAVGAWFVRFQR